LKTKATKNFNAIAIITTTIFCTAHPFTQPPKSYPLRYFSVGQTPQKCTFSWGHQHPHVIRLPWTHLTPHSKLHVDWFSRFPTDNGRVSL